MDDLSLTEQYQRYKIGTKYVVQWLADTAMDYTIVPTLVLARRENTNTVAGLRDITLSVDSLRQLAREIVERAQCTSRDPKGIDDTIVVLVDVVRGRREFAQH
ncbi:hypothetical protein CLAFUW4_08539 [Fulvia fulva]|uniref:DUF6604 domain-containing protein n=1 Tax=Passalora fulva TaxID=5499 RepID=A0A9Q8P6W0_PASFU|nr:uncharacterized protein CLAFUR5_08641 [Fulvia fulva]KAK4629755.1 hypothetical protein CLAFUR4_08544 [Fulvia fulva]KAK4630128.1 hypothetical protein CLAFUR0_08539 [Fulvia fulva]UJO15361.1 hypothetical protein CLAFUR5_08641 [Fulvia fulva]WPV12871.1 hypothetical protein CLAFUW4_08539 [Fulvia fulva]WPV26974.1 hypothetical protein CLAFUW7_08539 [Fulvia fulva]